MEHLKVRLQELGIDDTSIAELLQYVKDLDVISYQEGYDEGKTDGYNDGYATGYHLGSTGYRYQGY